MQHSALRDLEHFHRAGLDADATGDALGGVGHLRLKNDHAKGAGFLTLAAADAELLVHHANARFGVLRNRAVLTGRSTLAALHTGHRANPARALNNLHAGLVRVEFLIKGVGAGTHALQAGHALRTFLYGQFLHIGFPFCFFFLSSNIIQGKLSGINLFSLF